VGDDPELKASGHTEVTTKGELVGSIQQRRSGVFVRVVVVGRLIDEILVADCNRSCRRRVGLTEREFLSIT
jgi:hypothetical protein